jgi:hypothetical protein
LLALRKQQPNISRPFFLPFHNIICYISFYVCNLMLYWCGKEINIKLLVCVLISLIVAKLFYKESNQQSILKPILWFIVYICFLTIISYFGNFGGNGFIPAPFDYVALFLISLGILKWSVAVASRM